MKVLFSSVLSLFFFVLNAQEKVWTLTEMLSYAKENNLTLVDTKINNELAKNNIRATKLQKLPSVSANINNSLSAGAGDIPVYDANGNFSGSTNGYVGYGNNIGISASMVLFNHGLYGLQEEKAELDYRAAKLGLSANEYSLTINIINQYLNVILNKELSNANEEQLKLSQLLLERTQILYDAGAVALSEVYQAKAQVAQDKQSYESTLINIEQAKFNLAQLLQLPNYKDFEVADISADAVDSSLYTLNEVLDYVFNNHPSILRAKINAESADKSIEIAKNAYWPTLSTSYSFGTNYNTYLNKGVQSKPFWDQYWDNNAHTLGLGLNIPIFNKFLTDLNVTNAEIQKRASLNNIEIAKQNLRQDIQGIFFELESNYEQYIANKESVEAAQIALDFAQKSLDAGKISMYDYNQASNNLFRAKSQMYQAKYNYIFSKKVIEFYAGENITL